MKQTTMLLLLSTLLCTASLTAVPAYPWPVEITLPDGKKLSIMLKGDEYHSYTTTADGYPIVPNERGFYCYATMNADGTLRPGNRQAHNAADRNEDERRYLQSLQQTDTTLLRITRAARAKRQQATKGTAMTKPRRFPKTGSPKSLVILVNFSDKEFVTPDAQQAFTDLLNKRGYNANGATGSARDYFRDNSAGRFEPEFVVAGPYTLPQNMEFYGGNIGGKGTDRNRQQMIADACKAADEAGLDFGPFDTDGNNEVDNVFVYYAGYNEAEHGPANSIWPHQWELIPGIHYPGTIASITFDGKRVRNYACTSELKGFVGTTLCGIGTFCHEFGHVIGLPDLYPTGSADHHALGAWDIMDSGGYLNGGKTPAAYSAYERFFLGFLAPDIVPNTGTFTLDTLTTSNKAYLITQTDAHNLQGASPDPTEFFLLENRQKSGWDTYLPGHGLLITRVNYNAAHWNLNAPNNNPNAMGVDLMEADATADKETLSGDPFPGTRQVTAFALASRSGDKFHRTVANISETDGIIAFDVKKTGAITFSASDINYSAVVNNTHPEQSVNVNGVNIISPQLTYHLEGMHPDMFRLSGDGTLTAGGGNITVTFNPTAAGTYTAQLVVKDGEYLAEAITLTGTATLSDVAVPQVPANAEGIQQTAEGFVATWQPTGEADSYVLNVYTKTGAGITSVLTEDFSGFTDGEPNTKASSKNIAGELDSYTGLPGWTGTRVYAAGGSVKMGSGSAQGLLSTTEIDIAGNGGAFTLRFDATAWRSDRDSMVILLNNAPLQTVHGLDNTAFSFRTFSYKLTGGTSRSVIGFRGAGETDSRFFLDNLLVTQGTDGSIVHVPGSPFSTAEVQRAIGGLSGTSPYFYTVYAVKGGVNSALSAEVGPIALGQSSVDTVSASPLVVFAKDGQLFFNAPAGQTVRVYGVDGVLLYTGSTVDGTNGVPLTDRKGLVLVKVGPRTGKVKL